MNLPSARSTRITPCSSTTMLFWALCLSMLALWKTEFVTAWTTPTPVSKLLQTHSGTIERLKTETEKVVGADSMKQTPYDNDVFYLRYCVAGMTDDDTTDDEKVDLLQKNLSWRMNEGRAICDAAAGAFAEATSSGSWNNDPVLKSAPNYVGKIDKYLTPDNVVTTTTNKNDLVYCIRAGQIDDVDLMNDVSVKQMEDFFLYAKEVNAIVANDRSSEVDQLLCVVTANDLSGVKLVGGSSDFRKALANSAKIADDLYPNTAGPTLLLNLPRLLNALVKLFTPLFPPRVNARIKFAQGPLSDVDTLAQVTPNGSKRQDFLRDLENIVYG